MYTKIKETFWKLVSKYMIGAKNSNWDKFERGQRFYVRTWSVRFIVRIRSSEPT